MQQNKSNETGHRSRAARVREKKAGSSGMLLTTGAFLIVLCAILYGIFASHKDSGSKALEASTPPAAGNAANGGAGSGTNQNQGQAGDSANAGASANDSDTANAPDSAGTTDSPGAAGSANDAGTADAGQPSANAPSDSNAGDAPAAGDSVPDSGGNAAADTGTDTAPAADPVKQEPPKQTGSDKGTKAPAVSGHASGSKLPTTYVVKKGDTLSTISLKFYQSKQYVAFLAKRNGIAFVNDMKVGDTIKIPALTSDAASVPTKPSSADYSKVKLPATYLVTPGDTLYRISVLFYQSGDYVSFLAKQNNLNEKEGLKAGISLRIPAKPAAK
ncbi:LysM peptidoglycan-binding domain-containing protein [Paenibacillus rhizovicinus]|uniref:LysM peptidoglycan-binding domain-containing protein n=1 Tax=Paenibacillus rhizovicinus TaxID=2704463 RepID=A0A6C0P0R1_9BACL|nr:LysM peptidoglycan-binding domain-containing protein [Paenibacillus rhizovicinus]QHW32049.1 LysM peptidoglycan-binding domain-containing protein [Paenibacillus rhizovicinus]